MSARRSQGEADLPVGFSVVLTFYHFQTVATVRDGYTIMIFNGLSFVIASLIIFGAICISVALLTMLFCLCLPHHHTAFLQNSWH